MRAALIDGDLVVNIIEVGEDYDPPADLDYHELADDSPVGPGWSYAGGSFTAPTEVVVEPTPLEQVRADLDWLIGYVTTGEA